VSPTPHDAKELIRQSVDIVDLVGSYLPLRRQGTRFVALCPWHDDARPSLQVNPDRQSWKCWVCDIGGDIFNFVMQQEGVEFREALEMLAERAGVELRPKSPAAQTRPGDPGDKKTLLAALAWAERMFCECLQRADSAAAARGYLEQRGISAESCQRFHIGFSPDSWQWLLDRAGSTAFSPAVLMAAGLAGRSDRSGNYYDFFKGRVIFPIRDPMGRTIGFGGRVLPEFAGENVGKYINTRETKLFSKSEHVYGLDQARDAISKSREAVVVEGYTDVIMAHQFGLRNVVAVLGTALGPRHVRLLKRYADSVTLVLDGDEAGQRRTNEVLDLFIAGEVDLRILTLPEGADPCDFLLKQGADAMQRLLAGAVDALEHAIDVRTRGLDLVRDTHRAHQALEQLLAVMAQSPRLTAATKSARLLRERQMLARLARDFQVSSEHLFVRLNDLRRASSSAPMPRHRSTAAPASTPQREPIDPFEAELLQILIVHPELCDAALDELSPDQLVSSAARHIYDAVRRASERGELVEFSRILADLDDPALKNQLVELDERAQEKEPFTEATAPDRLRQMIDAIRDRCALPRRRELLVGLEQHRYDEPQELGVLMQLIDQERRRQGIPAPTDG